MNNSVKIMNSVSFKTDTKIQYSYPIDKKPNTFLNYLDIQFSRESQKDFRQMATYDPIKQSIA